MRFFIPRFCRVGSFALLGFIWAVHGPGQCAKAENGGTGTVRIAPWKDDKKGAFMLMFDDCCPSHVKNVYPELQKRNMTGTFYIVGNKPERKASLAFWEEEAAQAPFAVYGNHTMNHQGFPDLAYAEQDIAGCNELILRLKPGKNPRLISYAAPGGVKNEITKDEINGILGRNHLIERPTFNGHGAAIHQKTGAEILALADKAISNGGVEYIIFHGVGGDWISFDLGQFQVLMNGLDERKEQLWIADPISVHQYEKEKASTVASVVKNEGGAIQLELKCSEDPAFYDYPLTLLVSVPSVWKRCEVAQGDRKSQVEVKNGEVRFEAVPQGTVTLTPAS